MKTQDKKYFAEIMQGMADNFRDSITSQGLLMRFKILSEYSISQVEAAAITVMRNRKYTKMPTVAEIIEAIDGAPAQIEDKALTEANKIIAHLKTYGAGTQPDLSDPITKNLMTGRWPYQSWAESVLEKDIVWWVKEFCAAYKSFQVVEKPGLIESQVKIDNLTHGIGRAI
jgi:hypothetical protein